MKQGSSSYSTFRKRWFVLTDGKLLYFETRQPTFELGLIDLVNVTNRRRHGDAVAMRRHRIAVLLRQIVVSIHRNAIAVSSTGAAASALERECAVAARRVLVVDFA
jgi:hypothetical protein